MLWLKLLSQDSYHYRSFASFLYLHGHVYLYAERSLSERPITPYPNLKLKKNLNHMVAILSECRPLAHFSESLQHEVWQMPRNLS